MVTISRLLLWGEDYAWWSNNGREIQPGTFGENLTVESFDAHEWSVGDQVRIGSGESAVEMIVTALASHVLNLDSAWVIQILSSASLMPLGRSLWSGDQIW